MLAICFTVDDSIYAIKAACIDEVMPLVHVTKTPGDNPVFRGFIEYRGSNIPVFDMTQLIASHPCQPLLSTRIIIASLSCDTDTDADTRVALVAEKVHETMDLKDRDISNIPYKDDKNSCIEKIYNSAGKTIQLLKTDQILPDSLRESIQLAETGTSQHG